MIRFSSEAASELEDAIDWYLSRSIPVAGRFHQTFSSVLLNIEADPDRFARIHLDFQFARIIGFPFICRHSRNYGNSSPRHISDSSAIRSAKKSILL